MAVVSADRRSWTPIAMSLGKRAKYRVRADETRGMLAFYLPENALVAYRDPAGMDSQIFLRFCEHFVSETKVLRQPHRNLILTLGGYGAHTSYKALSLLRENKIHVLALPAHTSHRTQTLDYSVFSPFKTSLRNSMNDISLIATVEVRNDIYTLRELLHSAYHKSVTYTNIVNGLKGCGLCCCVRKRAIHEVIRCGDITSCGAYGSWEEAFVYKRFLSSSQTIL